MPIAAEAVPIAADADATIRAAEASAEQVERDLNRLTTFSADVRKALDEADKAKADVQHAMGSFRQQAALDVVERDGLKTKVMGLEEEVATLQRRIQELEDEKKACLADKATLTEASAKVQEQIDGVFKFGQAIKNGLAFKGLTSPANKSGS